jgi:hypothetical protein
MWEIALALAKAILQEQERREEAAAQEELALAIIAQVRLAIEQAKDQILDFLHQQRLDDFMGEVDGLFTTFVRYSGDPPHNEERLRELIDKLAILTARMARQLIRIDTDEQRSVDVFPSYASAVALTALAVTERRLRFHVVELMGGILGEAKVHSLRVRDVLRRRSDMRFRFTVVTEEPGSLGLGYTFNGVFELLAIVPTGGNTSVAREHVNRLMAEHQEREFPNYPGVTELLSFIRRLDDSISLDGVRLAISSQVPLFRAVVEDTQDGPQRRFRLA